MQTEEFATNPVAGGESAPAQGVENEPDLKPGDAQPEEGQATEPELEEIEFDGAKYMVPKPLKGGFLMERDYRQKTQSLADEKRSFTGERETFSKQQETHRAFLKDVGQLVAFDQAIEQLTAKIQQAQSQDEYNAMAAQLAVLGHHRTRLAGDLQSKEQQRMSQQQQEAARLRDEGRAAIAREIPGWSPQLESALTNFAAQFGYSAKEVAETLDPRAWRVMNELYRAKTAAPKQAAPVIPVRQVSSRAAPSTGPSDKDDTETWMKKERARVAKARG